MGDSINFDWVPLILVIRCFLVVHISNTKSIWFSYGDRTKNFILLPPNHESIESLDMVMNIPIATDYFAEFLEEYCSIEDPSATYLFTLYIDLR